MPINIPPIKWVGSPNYTQGRGKFSKPLAIVVHVMEGTIESASSWFQFVGNPKNEEDQSKRVSAHFGISETGVIEQYVSSSNTAWANGVINNPNWNLLKRYPSVNPNDYTISIEHEGYFNKPATPDQFLASVSLAAYLCYHWGIGRSGNSFNLIPYVDIIGHNQIDSVNRGNCPGKKINIEQYTQAVNDRLHSLYLNQVQWYEGFNVAKKLTQGTPYDAGEAVAKEETKTVIVQRQLGSKGKYLYTTDDNTLWVALDQSKLT